MLLYKILPNHKMIGELLLDNSVLELIKHVHVDVGWLELMCSNFKYPYYPMSSYLKCLRIESFLHTAFAFLSLPPNGVDAMIVIPSSREAKLYTALNLITHLLPGLKDPTRLKVALDSIIMSMWKYGILPSHKIQELV